MDEVDIKFGYVKGDVSPKKYLEHHISEIESSIEFYEIVYESQKYKKFFINTITNAFWELHNFDRKNDFWKGTNNLATFPKLSEFAKYNIERHFKKNENAWLSIALALVGGYNHFEIEWWRILLNNNEIDFEFLAQTAWTTSCYWNDSHIVTFSKLIKELDIFYKVESYLITLSQNGEDKKDWVEELFKEVKS